ncbi:isoleucyl-tRNA synthetase family protein [Cryptosporidium andersoni]|uniref:isoleucine--tRNA ligase n=1 Tax=Cryptosporidium andersoni TaxID=117008 RepID=A0A1J4MR23_9CRYT|nr:isoleucyl-tRNA synthetase family protein [Cryptosporidium andersoni]
MPTFQQVLDRPDFPAMEEEVLEFWKSIDVLNTSLKKAQGRPRYSFYDGPPFATGLPHYGHILAGTIKDIITRYAQQKGYYCERRFGWDCHGLPVEYEIDKLLNISGRDDIINMGIDKYNESCRAIVLRYTEKWRTTVERVGRWIDFDNDYRTMDPSFMQSVWWVFKQLYDKGLVYRAYRVMPYSTICSTPLSNFEANLNYKDVSDPSIIISFPSEEDPNVEFLAWTTTPWTLPANTALAVHPELIYVYFKPENSNKKYVVCENRLDWVLSELKIKDYIIESTCMGNLLHNIKLIPLFNYYRDSEGSNKFWRILADPYVTDSTGTGLVHMAPAFGEDDFRVCTMHDMIDIHGNNLPCPMDPNGKFIEPASDYIGVWFKDADKAIRQKLKKEGRLLSDNTCVHSYPHCWRSDSPLQYRAVPSWFINVESLKEKLLKNNNETYWVPKHVKEKRFHNWLQDAKDWCISRNRFWGTPIPLWVSEDFSIIHCIGSIDELEKLAINLKEPISDIHRHFVDSITIPDPRGDSYPPLKRIDEVFDCWFESGSMPYASLYYPFKNKDYFNEIFPADFVSEGLDQTRGWFYTLMILSTALFDKPAFKNLIVSGLVLASDGKKMSKRLKNYPDTIEVVNKYGADALRLYLINSPVVRAETLRFKEEGVRDVVKDVLLPWYHCYRFFIQEASRFENNTGGSFKSNSNIIRDCTNIMDIWIYSEAQSLIKFFRNEMDQYRLYTVSPKLIEFLDNLCNWYVRLNRDRMRGSYNSDDTLIALEVLFEVLIIIIKLMCPFSPFLCESLYKNLRSAFDESQIEDSIHFLLIPDYKEEFIKPQIEVLVEQMREIIIMGRTIREKRKVSLKVPLKNMVIIHRDKKVLEDLVVSKLTNYIKEELNVLEVQVDSNSQFEQITKLVAIPNFRSLGQKLGKHMKEVTNIIKSMTTSDIQEFLEKKSIEICGFNLGEDDIIIQTIIDPIVQSNSPNISYDGDSKFIIGLDFTSDRDFELMAYARELANKIQKLRKRNNMDPNANVTIYIEQIENINKFIDSNNKFVDMMNSYDEYLQKIIRKPIKYIYSNTNIDNVIFSDQIEIGFDIIKVIAALNI